MDETIRKHIANYNKANDWGDSDGDIIETIKESEVIWRGGEEKHRWWNEYFYVTKIDKMLIGYCNAEANRDESVADLGYEFNPDSICQVEKKQKVVDYYAKKS